MTIDVETFEDPTGWTSDGSMTVAQNQIPNFIALHKTASLIVSIPSGNLGKKVTKTLSVAINAGFSCNEIVLSIWSQKLASNTYDQISDFSYMIKFASGSEYYLPVFEGFEQVSFFVSGLAEVTEFTITALTDNSDSLVLSACVAVLDEYPLDILKGMQDEIKLQVKNETGVGFPIGTFPDVAAGSSMIDLAGFPYVDRMATVLFTDGFNSEIHAFDLTDEVNYRLASTYDGPVFLNSFSGKGLAVYINFPVEFGRYEEDAVFPGIFLWKMTAEPIMRSSDVDTIMDTTTGSSWQSRRVPINENYRVLIDVEARHPRLLAIMNRAVKRFLGLNILWINGRKHTFQWTVPPVEIEPDQSVEQFPKVQYEVSIEVQEERENRIGVYGGLSTQDLTVQPVEVLP